MINLWHNGCFYWRCSNVVKRFLRHTKLWTVRHENRPSASEKRNKAAARNEAKRSVSSGSQTNRCSTATGRTRKPGRENVSSIENNTVCTLNKGSKQGRNCGVTADQKRKGGPGNGVRRRGWKPTFRVCHSGGKIEETTFSFVGGIWMI